MDVERALVWELKTGNAWGTLKVDSGETFTMNHALADNVSETNDSWDGKTLTKTGAGTLILAENNTYSGETKVNEGTLEVTGALGSGNDTDGHDYEGKITIANGSTLAFNQTVEQTLSGAITGGESGTLTKDGTGNWRRFAPEVWLPPLPAFGHPLPPAGAKPPVTDLSSVL